MYCYIVNWQPGNNEQFCRTDQIDNSLSSSLTESQEFCNYENVSKNKLGTHLIFRSYQNSKCLSEMSQVPISRSNKNPNSYGDIKQKFFKETLKMAHHII